MATTYIGPPWLNAPSPRVRPRPYVDDFSDLFRDREELWEARRGRRRAVRALGGVLVAGAIATAAWMASATPARDAIASWGTLGAVSQQHLGVATLDDDAAPLEHDAFDNATSTLVWALGPAPAERSRSIAAKAHARVIAPIRRAPIQSDADDPYAGVLRVQQPASDPYDAVEVGAAPAAQAPYNPDGI